MSEKHASFDATDAPQFTRIADSLGVPYRVSGWVSAHNTFPFWSMHTRLLQAMDSGDQGWATSEFSSLLWACAGADPSLHFAEDDLVWLGERMREYGAVSVLRVLLVAVTENGRYARYQGLLQAP